MSQTMTVAEKSGQPETRALRVALVGCGERGAALCPHVVRAKNARLTMLMDANASLGQDLAQRFNLPSTTSYDEVLGSKDVDAVMIATPHHVHAPQAIQAAQAGKHIMVEKPMASNLRDAVAMADAARQAGVALSVILPYRYMPRTIRARELVQAGALGELFGCLLVFHDDKFSDYWSRGHKGRTLSDWRMRWETSGGGVVITSAIHHMDWLRYVPGLEITEVAAWYATKDSPGEVEDNMTIAFKYETGAVGSVTVSSSVRGTDFSEVRFWGRDGHISMTPPYQFYSLKAVEGKRPGQWHQMGNPKGVSNRDLMYVERFADRVLRGEPPEITAEDGLAVQAIIEAAYESGRTGRVVRVERPWATAKS